MSARNKLAITTPSEREIAMTRAFDAPRALVWQMFTRPEHVRQWWGHGHLEVTVCEIDLRVGGAYRYTGRTPDGMEVPFRGVYREIVAPERLVLTEIYDVPMARDHEGVVTTTFTEAAGKTTVHSVVRYDSKETRDMVLASGMESGVASGYDRIDELLQAASREAG
ncbi:MAG TPA: SRPBCC family protein [Kofleriaceae bacterium]|nr:SRPBCC family protein [Kofleriaceae bacterium]